MTPLFVVMLSIRELRSYLLPTPLLPALRLHVEGRISQREIQAFAERPADLPWPPSKHPNTLFTHGAPSAAATTTLALELHEIQVKDELTTGMFSWKKVRNTMCVSHCLARPSRVGLCWLELPNMGKAF